MTADMTERYDGEQNNIPDYSGTYHGKISNNTNVGKNTVD